MKHVATVVVKENGVNHITQVWEDDDVHLPDDHYSRLDPEAEVKAALARRADSRAKPGEVRWGNEVDPAMILFWLLLGFGLLLLIGAVASLQV